MKDTARLEKALGHRFSDASLLELALTHRSAGKRNNERLEFLGDSLLNFVIAQDLFRRFDDTKEGALSRLRARLVRGETLADLGLEMDLGPCLRLGAGERRSGGHRRRSIIADAVEALFGAVLLDAGVDRAREVILNQYQSLLEGMAIEDARKDAKTRLQEYVQARNHPLPRYELVSEEGEDHARQFTVECILEQPALSRPGEGSSRRKAEQRAARSVLEELESRD
jgi:ribonuclease-3